MEQSLLKFKYDLHLLSSHHIEHHSGYVPICHFIQSSGEERLKFVLQIRMFNINNHYFTEDNKTEVAAFY